MFVKLIGGEVSGLTLQAYHRFEVFRNKLLQLDHTNNLHLADTSNTLIHDVVYTTALFWVCRQVARILQHDWLKLFGGVIS